MNDSATAFYDLLAADYHLIYADWRASVRRQGAVLDAVIGAALGPDRWSILDCACGIGTQTIGLALHGHRVHGTDISGAAVERARREAATFGVEAIWGVADMRDVTSAISGRYDVVLACDNALPHLLTDVDLDRAVVGMAARLRPGGLVLASLRDYDRLAEEAPRTEGPRVLDGPDGRRIAFQVWDWAEDRRGYRLHQFILRSTGDEWRTFHAEVDYRALRRAELSAALLAAGLAEVSWREPETTGFHQPIVTARAL